MAQRGFYFGFLTPEVGTDRFYFGFLAPEDGTERFLYLDS